LDEPRRSKRSSKLPSHLGQDGSQRASYKTKHSLEHQSDYARSLNTSYTINGHPTVYKAVSVTDPDTLPWDQAMANVKEKEEWRLVTFILFTFYVFFLTPFSMERGFKG
jgi:hypothetical protein